MNDRRDHRLVLALLVGTGSLGLAATSIYLPSIPDMARDLAVPVGNVQNTVTAYLAAFAVSTLVLGSLSDRFGRRPLLVAGTALFAVASAVGALVPDIRTLMIVRVLQAIGACAGIALARAVARDLFSHEGTARALAAISAAISITPIVAPLVGGYVHAWFGWRANFLLLALVAAPLTWLVARHVPETNRMLQNQRGVVRGLVTNAVTLIRERHFVGYVLVVSGSSSAFYAYLTAAPVLLIDHHGSSPEAVGRYLMLGPAGYVVAAMISNRTVRSSGTDALIGVGAICLLLAAVSLVIAAGSPHTWPFLAPFVAAGAGMGFCLPNGNAGAMSVQPRLAGTAAGVAGFLQSLTCALATAAVASHELRSARPVALLWVALATLTFCGWIVARAGRTAIVRL